MADSTAVRQRRKCPCLSADFGFPAEREFPLSVVAGHGVLAVATVTLVPLTLLTG